MSQPDFVRRALMQGFAASLMIGVLPAGAAESATTDDALAELQRKSGGRLGAYIMDTASKRAVGLNADARFGMCSTFKLLLAAAVLREVDAGRMHLDTFVPYGQDDIVPHAPVTELHLADGGMTIGALAEAAQTTSDNVAANLLLRLLGGPQAVTAIVRAMGDDQTRLDRIEPLMNLVPPGEVRDTTTPRAMAESAARVVVGDILQPASRTLLRDWMIATDTGRKRIRAGLPVTWIAGDKTGTGVAEGMHNKHNDVAVIWPPGRAPVVVSAYFESNGYYDSTRPEDDAVLAEVGRLAAAWIVTLPA